MKKRSNKQIYKKKFFCDTIINNNLYCEEIWSRYENGAEKKYVPQVLIEIKRLIDDGRSKLNDGHYMQALDSVQKSQQRLAEIPELMEKGKVILLEEEKNRAVSKLKAAEILDLATKEAAKIKLEAGKEAEMIIREYMRASSHKHLYIRMSLVLITRLCNGTAKHLGGVVLL